ncbi:MAG: bifunctional phosphopantothenoylcysteine decarboxylase/phosphopantothenate--cysteine ligase CoaBC [Bacteroidales bacterium]
MLKGKKIILGISGGIAAYKSLSLIRLFIKAGAEVRVVLTKNAEWFVTRVSLESLSQNKVYHQVFAADNDYTTEHISLTDWGDVMVVAPATANIIGKYANGIADDALSTSLISFNKKVFVAPAMNVKMYENFAVQKNMEYLRQNNVAFIESAEGYLACGYEGKGRMEEPEEIFEIVKSYFSASAAFTGKSILVTAGPTHEKLDPVRFLGNYSSGKMGMELALELAQRGANVQLVSGPVNQLAVHPNIKLTKVVSADQMYDACTQIFPEMDAAVMTAAVADYKPRKYSSQKLKGEKIERTLQLVPNKDILATLGEMKKEKQILAGFALETHNEEANAIQKRKNKNLDFIVLNSLNEQGAGFGLETNKITIIDNKDKVFRFELKTKKQVACDIIDKLQEHLNINL